MNTDTCFPLQPFVSLNSEFFKAGHLGSGIIKKKKIISGCASPRESLTGPLWAFGDGDSGDELYRKALYSAHGDGKWA